MIFKFHPAPRQKLNTCAFSPLRLPVMLPLHRWQSNHHEFRRHHMVSRADPDTDVQTCFFIWARSVSLTLRSLPQCTVGHRDESADYSFLGPQRRRHESVPVARPPHLCVRSLRRFGQTVGHQGQHVPADLHRPRVGHQRHLCECAQGNDRVPNM